jgi:hypothetical protein
MADPARDTALSELVARVRGLTGPVGMTEAREIALFAREQAGLKALASDYLRCALEHGDLNAAERLRQVVLPGSCITTDTNGLRTYVVVYRVSAERTFEEGRVKHTSEPLARVLAVLTALEATGQ